MAWIFAIAIYHPFSRCLLVFICIFIYFFAISTTSCILKFHTPINKTSAILHQPKVLYEKGISMFFQFPTIHILWVFHLFHLHILMLMNKKPLAQNSVLKIRPFSIDFKACVQIVVKYPDSHLILPRATGPDSNILSFVFMALSRLQFTVITVNC